MSCFICLDEEDVHEPFTRLCSTCLESKICPKCERDAYSNFLSNPDVVSNCPICRRPSSTGLKSEKLFLFSYWHPLVYINWLFLELRAPLWQCILILFLSSSFLSGIVRRMSLRKRNELPSTVFKRFKILSLIIHLPYIASLWCLRGIGDDVDFVFDLYIVSHLIFPSALFLTGKLVGVI